MHPLIFPSLEVLLGLVLLVWSADRFVDGAAALAKHSGVSSLVIGLTIVGLGTSAPEMLVSLLASINGSPDLAIGNALGSNITNIALVIGCTAIILPIAIGSRIVRTELPILLIVSLGTTLLLIDGTLNRVDGLLLIAGIFLVMSIIIRNALKQRSDVLKQELDTQIPRNMTLARAVFWLVLGLAVLLLSAKMLVDGSVSIAHYMGISELVIGLTIVAIGTSLPELAASVAAALKRQDEIAIGNVIGSNIFNLLVVLGIPGTIATTPLPDGVLNRDLPFMLILTILLFAAAAGTKKRPGKISRLKGSLLLLCFIAYQVMLFRAVIST